MKRNHHDETSKTLTIQRWNEMRRALAATRASRGPLYYPLPKRIS